MSRTARTLGVLSIVAVAGGVFVARASLSVAKLAIRIRDGRGENTDHVVIMQREPNTWRIASWRDGDDYET